MALCIDVGFDAIRAITEGMKTNAGTTTPEGSDLMRPDPLAFSSYSPYCKKYMTLNQAVLGLST
jgi:hypothetical protein